MISVSSNLAASLRPSSFSQVVGHVEQRALLQKAIHNKALPVQLLFSGPSGLGKTTLARICAAALLCERSEETCGDACMECESCLSIVNRSEIHPDVVEFDAASHGGKEQIMDLASKALLAPVKGDRRVYIIDEAHGLSHSGAQAFLKLLEEPPEHITFMLCTTDPQKMLKTIRGRCVEIRLARPSQSDLVEHAIFAAKSVEAELDVDFAATMVEVADPDLGVRGILNMVQQVIALKNTGASTDQLYSLVGVLNPSDIENLISSLVSGDTVQSIETLDGLLMSSTPAVVKSSLVRHYQRDFYRAIHAKNTAKLTATSSALRLVMETSSASWDLRQTVVILAEITSTATETPLRSADADHEPPPKLHSSEGQAVEQPAAQSDCKDLEARLRDSSKVLATMLDSCTLSCDANSISIYAPARMTDNLRSRAAEIARIADRSKVEIEISPED